MAEIRFPKPTAWAAFELETKLLEPPVLNLELTPRSKREAWQASAILTKYIAAAGVGAADIPPELKLEAMSEFVPMAVSHVVGWDLTQNGEPIPCDPKTKGGWLEPLLWETVKAADGDEADVRWLWSEIIRFINDEGNFLKN